MQTKHRFFGRLIPRTPNFFPMLKEMSEASLVASDLIIRCVTNYDHSEAIQIYAKIKEQEKKSDCLSKKIFDDLNVTFLTPFDREDIHRLADRLDDVTNDIKNCAKRIVLFKPQQLPPESLMLASMIKEGVLYIIKALQELENLHDGLPKIKEYCKELHVLENRADEIYENYVLELFKNEKNSIEIIKLKEIMFELEKATDTTEYVGKIIQTILVKNA